jgi:hypothetical protein
MCRIQFPEQMVRNWSSGHIRRNGFICCDQPSSATAAVCAALALIRMPIPRAAEACHKELVGPSGRFSPFNQLSWLELGSRKPPSKRLAKEARVLLGIGTES